MRTRLRLRTRGPYLGAVAALSCAACATAVERFGLPIPVFVSFDPDGRLTDVRTIAPLESATFEHRRRR